MKKLIPRNLDHVVFAVPSLKLARQRMERLGFFVAPDARHKFGSENACIFFADGTFIEPLAIGHRETVNQAIKTGNLFLRRDMAYRFRNGEEGFSMFVFGDRDPVGSSKAIRKAGWETGRLVTVRRPGIAVRIILGVDERAPDCTAFLCERPEGPCVFPQTMSEHANGALGIGRVTLGEQLPEDFQYYLQIMSGQREIRSHSLGMDFTLPNGNLSVMNHSGLKLHYGIEAAELRGLRSYAIDIEVKSLKITAEVMNRSGIAVRRIGERLIVDPAPGQGAVIAFVEG